MVRSVCLKTFLISCFLTVLAFAQRPVDPSSQRAVLLEIVRNSWNVERNETLVYLRVYTDGFAEAHPMATVDFRNITFHSKQLSPHELAELQALLGDPSTAQLLPEYSRYWGNRDFGVKDRVEMFGSTRRVITLVNFQPFLARKQGKPYPKQLEKLGCLIWRLRTKVSGEPLEKDWLSGCTQLGY